MSTALPPKMRMQLDFFQLRDIKIGRRPTRVDMFESSDIPMREFLREGWLRFLKQTKSLCSEEAGWLNTEVEEFLYYLERTRMVKAYKIPTVASFLDLHGVVPKVSLARIGRSMLDFYHDNAVHQNDLTGKSNRNWRLWGEKEFAALSRRNPVRYLNKSRFFHYDEVNEQFSLAAGLHPFLSPILAGHIRDILVYRCRDFFYKRCQRELGQ